MTVVPFSVPKPPTPSRAKSRTFEPRFPKPANSHCSGCPLETRGQGYVPAYGTQLASPSPIVFVGEAPWFDEVAQGEPLVGASGAMLNRVLKLIGHTREDYRLDNLLRCAVPGMEIAKWPSAVAQCRYLDDHLRTLPAKVLVPLGTVPTRRLLNLQKVRHAGVENFHGTVTWSAEHHAWVVPTYHPAHLVRGATNLMGTVAFDLRRAHEVADKGWDTDPASVIVDPPLDWFKLWAAVYIDAVRRDGPWWYPLAVDIETPDKGTDEGALVGTESDASYQIERINFSCNADEGISIAWTPEVASVCTQIFKIQGICYFWYKGFDYPRLVKAGMPILPAVALDCMWMWKALQSDLPQGLGFVAPFYSRFGAWKHLNESHPGQYAAIDGLQTRRIGDGVVADLTAQGRWPVYQRHMHDFHRIALQPATDVGVPIDRAKLTAFKAKLDAHCLRFLTDIQPLIPEALRPLTPKMGLTRPPKEGVAHAKGRTTTVKGVPKKETPDPLKVDLYAGATVIEKLVLAEIQVCRTCGKQEVAKTHNCQQNLPEMDGIKSRPIIEKAIATVTRWFWQEPFNPDSPTQLMAYLKYRGHQPGKAKATGKESTDREAMNRLVAETDDPLYPLIVDYRAVQKIRGTYVDGTFRRLDAEDRVHPETTFKPSTFRTSQTNPNYQNIVADRGGKESLAAGFRSVVVARGREEGAPAVWSAAKILEFDFSAIEAVLMGWFMRDLTYLRLAKLGVHAYLASHVLKRPADLTWEDAQLAAYFKAIKKSTLQEEIDAYERCKRVVHGTAYGLTTHGMMRNFPKTFPSLKIADALQRTYFAIAPEVPRFHQVVRQTAHDSRKLGGAETYDYQPETRKVIGHPYGYLHWFWSVVSYKRLDVSQMLWRRKRHEPFVEINGIGYAETLGEDAKRCIAFYPQSTARGVLTEACFPLFDPEDPQADTTYIGDYYYGATPLRAPIHDSLLLECPTRKVDALIERVAGAMQAPVTALPCPVDWGLGAYLTIGVDAKIGDDWGAMTPIALPSLTDLGVAHDVPYSPAEDADEDDVADLEVSIGG